MPTDLSKQLDMLDEFLLGGAVGDDAMLLSELDGFLAGLIVGPDPVMPSEWLPVVWGEDSPAFEGERQAQAIVGAIMEHYNDIIRQLDRDRYSPIYDLDNDDRVLWETWIEGFWRAVSLRPDEWAELVTVGDEDLETAVFSLGRLYEMAALPSAELDLLKVDEEVKKLAPDLIPFAVGILHRKRLAARSGSPASAATKVGRNEPCPCGSGKKFKKCCMK